MMFPGEQESVKAVLKEADRFGYGNMIAHLRAAWALKLMVNGMGNLNEKQASDATASEPYPLKMHQALIGEESRLPGDITIAEIGPRITAKVLIKEQCVLDPGEDGKVRGIRTILINANEMEYDIEDAHECNDNFDGDCIASEIINIEMRR